MTYFGACVTCDFLLCICICIHFWKQTYCAHFQVYNFILFYCKNRFSYFGTQKHHCIPPLCLKCSISDPVSLRPLLPNTQSPLTGQLTHAWAMWCFQLPVSFTSTMNIGICCLCGANMSYINTIKCIAVWIWSTCEPLKGGKTRGRIRSTTFYIGSLFSLDLFWIASLWKKVCVIFERLGPELTIMSKKIRIRPLPLPKKQKPTTSRKNCRQTATFSLFMSLVFAQIIILWSFWILVFQRMWFIICSAVLHEVMRAFDCIR